MAKVALVYTEKQRRVPQYAYPGHLGISYISSSLKSKGHEVLVADANQHPSVVLRVDSFSPDYIGINVSQPNHSKILRFIKIMRALHPSAKIILGGTHMALDSKGAMEHTQADFGVIGDGTYTLEKIISGELSTQGIVYRNGAGVISNGFADYAMDSWRVDPSTLPLVESGAYTFVSSMGCFGKCAFCTERIVSPKVSFRSVESTVEDMERLNKERKVRLFIATDSNFLMNPLRFIALDEEMARRGIQQKINFQTRVDDVLKAKEELAHLKERIHGIELGVESFIPSQIERYGKGTTIEQNLAALEFLRASGISARINLIPLDQDVSKDECLKEAQLIIDFFSDNPQYLPLISGVSLRGYNDNRDKRYPAYARIFEELFGAVAKGNRRYIRENTEKAYFKGKNVPDEAKRKINEMLKEDYTSYVIPSATGKKLRGMRKSVANINRKLLSLSLSYLYNPEAWRF